MAGISGMNDYSFLFTSSSSSGNNLASLTNSLFSGTSNSMLGDYAMIKSGAYKKLLTAYYKTQENDSDSTSTDKTTQKEQTSEETNKYLAVKNQATDLKTSSDALNDYSLYKGTAGEDGTITYDRDAIKKAVSSFVSDYNSLISSSTKVDSTSVLSKTLSLVKETSSNQKLLNSIGITIGQDNKLVLDEEKLNSADINKISSLFKGSGSYGNVVSSKASEIARQANSNAYGSTKASSYSQSGSYSVMGNTNSMLDQLL